MNKGEELSIEAALEKILSRLEEIKTEMLDRFQELDETLEDCINRHPFTGHAYDNNLSDDLD